MNATDSTPSRATSEADRRYANLLIALNLCHQLSRSTTYRLAEKLDTWADLRSTRIPAGLAGRLRVSREELATALALRREAPRLAAEETSKAEEVGARILTRAHADFPTGLGELSSPPPVLYVRGELPAELARGRGITMVGSRRTDRYGSEVARLFARELAGGGAVVLSGFAQGVDAAAHRGALEATGGSTVAVLGCGLGVDYPRGHRRLGEEIAQRGALISELPVGTPPAPWQFPVRNRILAALARAVLVVRATARSGSLITARHALELGRDIYAIPGNLFDPRSMGPNALIRDGAYPALHPREILEIMGLAPPVVEKDASPPEDGGVQGSEIVPDAARRLLGALVPTEPRAPEELAEELGMPIATVLTSLLELELAGAVERVVGGRYCRPGTL